METLSALLTLCEGISPVAGEFPTKRPVMRSFDVFLDLHLIKRLNKQSWGWWFETHYDVTVMRRLLAGMRLSAMFHDVLGQSIAMQFSVSDWQV